MTLRYRFHLETTSGGLPILRPRIPIVLVGPMGRKPILALLDSAGDVTIVPRDVARAVGLRLEPSPEHLRGVGGKMRGRGTTVDILLGRPGDGHRLTDVTAFVPEDPYPSAVLGRPGVFDRLAVEFRLAENLILLHRA